MFEALARNLPDTILSGSILALIILLAKIIEENFPNQRDQSQSDIFIDYKIVASTFLMRWLGSPFTTLCAITLGRQIGTGLIYFPSESWLVVPSFAVCLIIADFITYWLHRASHAIPALWALHSLHHSARAVTASTSARRTWIEDVISQALIVPILGAIFSVPIPIIIAIGLVRYVVVIFAHLNVDVFLGLAVNSPRYHRVHHSADPEHFNKNFAEIFPIWDSLFRTSYKQTKMFTGATGLPNGEAPDGVIDSLFWPFRCPREAPPSSPREQSTPTPSITIASADTT